MDKQYYQFLYDQQKMPNNQIQQLYTKLIDQQYPHLENYRILHKNKLPILYFLNQKQIFHHLTILCLLLFQPNLANYNYLQDLTGHQHLINNKILMKKFKNNSVPYYCYSVTNKTVQLIPETCNFGKPTTSLPTFPVTLPIPY